MLFKNKISFEDFFNTLEILPRRLDFFTDFDKCLKNRDEQAWGLSKLDFLLNASSLENGIKFLFKKGEESSILILAKLLALHKKQEKKEKLILQNGCVYPDFKTLLSTPEGVLSFLKESSLDRVFTNQNLRCVRDYFLGVELGLDSNARKNRSGKLAEEWLSSELSKRGFKKNEDFFEQVSLQNIPALKGVFEKDNKVVDFLIKTPKTTVILEINYYATSGSKPNEVARAYIAKAFADIKGYAFVWFTHGPGWKASKNKLEEAYKEINIFNFAGLDSFLRHKIA